MINLSIVFDHRNKAGEKPGAIEIRLIKDRKPYYINTGIKVLKRNFVGGSIVGQFDALELNERLAIIYNKVQSEVNRCLADDMTIDVKVIKERVWSVIDGDATEPLIDWIEDSLVMMNGSDGTRKHYVTLLTRLREYGRMRRWSDVTTEELYRWDAWLHRLPARQSQQEKRAGVEPERISTASVYNYHKCLKASLNRAVLLGKIDANPYDRMKGAFKRGDNESVEYLTEDEIEAFCVTMPPIGSEMDVAHDLFVFQIFTGLSYSDTQEFDISNYKLQDGTWRAVTARIKTGVPYVSMLLPQAVAVLKKYGMTTPRIANARYNLCLKALGMVAGISTPLHSHIARHTFATMMLRNGAKIQNVSKMLGHTNITQTQRYAKVLAQSVYEDFEMVAKKNCMGIKEVVQLGELPVITREMVEQYKKRKGQ